MNKLIFFILSAIIPFSCFAKKEKNSLFKSCEVSDGSLLLEYLPQEMRLFDHSGLKSIFHFKKDNRLEKIEYFNEQDKTVLLTEQMIWQGNWCIARAFARSDNQPELVQYFYKKNARDGFCTAWFQRTETPVDELPKEVEELIIYGKKLYPLSEELSTYEKITEFFQKVRNAFSYEPQLAKDLEAFLENTLGEQHLAFEGWFPESSKLGVIGDKDISKKTRVTFINGILNRENLCHSSAEQLSKWHGGQRIYYVYMASLGWPKDLVKAVLSKKVIEAPEVKMLAILWKKLLRDAGGVENGATIIHYAHSQGVVITRQAVLLLTPEERKALKIHCLATPSFMLEEEAKDFQYYVSKRDFVALLDPIGLSKAILQSDANVEFIGSFLDLPLFEHRLDHPSYMKVLEDLGNRFLQEFQSQD